MIGVGDRRPLAALPVEGLVAEEVEADGDQQLGDRESEEGEDDGPLHGQKLPPSRLMCWERRVARASLFALGSPAANAGTLLPRWSSTLSLRLPSFQRMIFTST